MADQPDDGTASGRSKRSKRERLIGAFSTGPRSSGESGWGPLTPPAATPAVNDDAKGAAGPDEAPSGGPADVPGYGNAPGPGGPRSVGSGVERPGTDQATGGRGTMAPEASPATGKPGAVGPAAGSATGGRWSGTQWQAADHPDQAEAGASAGVDAGSGDLTERIAIGSPTSYPPVFAPSGGRPTRDRPTDGHDDHRKNGGNDIDGTDHAAHGATPDDDSKRTPPIDIVGLHGGQWFGRTAEAALREADVLIGHARQLAVLPDDPPLPGKPVELWGNLDEVLGFAAEHRGSGGRACILAAGDPGFFGLVRLAAARLGDAALRVHPAPSSVALAFARIGANWDDALVVSAHGRPLEHAVAAAVDHPKVAVLVSKDQPPQALGRALVEAGCGDRSVAVCSRLGETDEQVVRTDLAGLAAGRFDPLSVVIVEAPDGGRPADTGMGLRWGRPEADFAHRDGMVTKAEVRAVALGKLGLPRVGTLWDVGAGSGSVAIECARLAPGLRIYAVERRTDDIERIRVNAQGAGLTVVSGTAPEVLADLPDPDRAFVGGGGLDVLDAVLARLRPGGVVVATYATLATAAAAAERLGNIVQVQVNRGVPVGPAGRLRLAAENPVFVCWGPTA